MIDLLASRILSPLHPPSLHDHIPLREYLQARAAAWRAEWHALDGFDERYFSPAELTLRAEVLRHIDELVALSTQLVEHNRDRFLRDRT